MAINMAIIGYGGMGGWHHASIRQRVPQIQVTGAYDIRQEARQKAQENGLYTYNSLEELLDDSSVELVTVATPNNFHKPLVIRCLEAGKNVVCEKPVAVSYTHLIKIYQNLLAIGAGAEEFVAESFSAACCGNHRKLWLGSGSERRTKLFLCLLGS